MPVNMDMSNSPSWSHEKVYRDPWSCPWCSAEGRWSVDPLVEFLRGSSENWTPQGTFGSKLRLKPVSHGFSLGKWVAHQEKNGGSMAYIINISVVFKVVCLLQPMYHYAFIHSPVIIIPDLQEISGNHGWMLSAVCDAPISRFKASKDLTTNKWMCIYI